MNSLELIAEIQRDRERTIERDRLARAVARIKACCSPSAAQRLARVTQLGRRVFRPAPATCQEGTR